MPVQNYTKQQLKMMNASTATMIQEDVTMSERKLIIGIMPYINAEGEDPTRR